MIDRSKVTDPLLLAVLDEAAKVRPEDVDLDLDDPAFVALVDRAVAPAARSLTAQGMERARKVAALSLATRPDIEALMAQVRGGPEGGGPPGGASGKRPKRDKESLARSAERGPRGGTK